MANIVSAGKIILCNNLSVDKEQYFNAIKKGPEGFVNCMVTAAFTFDEVMSSTLMGRKRKVNEEENEETQKGLSRDKLETIFGKYSYSSCLFFNRINCFVF